MVQTPDISVITISASCWIHLKSSSGSNGRTNIKGAVLPKDANGAAVAGAKSAAD